MGRAIVLPYPTHGHIAPILGVAEELVKRGEDVIFYATGRSRTKIEATGATFRPYERGHDAFNPTPPTEGLFADMARLAGLTEAILPGLLAELRALSPDYLLVDTKSLWGRLAGMILGVPAVTLSVVFAIQSYSIAAADLVRLLYAGAPAAPLLSGLADLTRYLETAFRTGRRFGVPLPGIVDYLGNPQPLNVIFTSREFQIRGETFGDAFQFVGPSLPPATSSPDTVGDRPLIYISLGTTFHNALGFYRSCMEALADEACQVVLSTGGVGYDLGAIPSNFVVRTFVPQLEILKQARVFVTHGGMNSTNEGLWFGVPLLVVPQRGDQHLVAARVAELGAGIRLNPSEAAPDRLRNAVRALLGTPQYTERAKAIGATLRASGGPQRAAEAILRCTSASVRRPNS